ncbi:MAG: EF-hand domain-containing protein [Aquabacterium sp.]|nr:MAG: EF-hand domain-containing protein [Aquabacterium sp.]
MKTRHPRFHAAAAVLLATTSALCAMQAVQAADAAASAAGSRSERLKAEFEARFKKADANGDGKLTKDEAKNGMPRVAAHFDEIDRDKHGSITPADIAAWMREQKGKRGR